MGILKNLLNKIKKPSYSSYSNPPKITRKFNVNGIEITADYHLNDGYLCFFGKSGDSYELTNAGAFSTIKALSEAFNDVKLDKISYMLNVRTPRGQLRDKFYARELEKRGYRDAGRSKTTKAGNYHRYFVRKPQKKTGNLESYLSKVVILTFSGSVFFLLSNITGSVIGNLNQSSINWIGGVLFLIGLIILFIYLKRKSKTRLD